MGWRFKWVSSHGNDFNFDYHVSFTKEDEKKDRVYYNYETGGIHERRTSWPERVLQR